MVEELAKNEFYMKKQMKACRVRDSNKDGYLSRSDFEMIIQRYKDAGFPDKAVRKLSDYYAKFMELVKISDPGTKLTMKRSLPIFRRLATILKPWGR